MPTLQYKYQHLKNLSRTCLDGYKSFRETGSTPPEAYYAFRALFVESNGWSNDLFQIAYGLRNPATEVIPLQNSIIKGFTPRQLSQAVRSLETDGYYVFPGLIGKECIESLTKFSFETPAYLQRTDYYSEKPESLFNPLNLVASNYRFDEADVANHPYAQALMGDPVLLALTQKYFRSHCKLSTVQTWWTTPFGFDSPQSNLAQMYHFDMDRIKFLNFFLYLTDVDAGSGPHCYIRNSHRRKPKSCLEDRRFSDEEIAAAYPSKDHVEILGPAGTLIAVDGRGFHKAKMPTSGNRLIFSITMCSNLFGQNYPKPKLAIQDANLKHALRLNPQYCSRFELVSTANTNQDRVFAGAGY